MKAKRWGSRLRFAVMLLFYRAGGRSPRAAAEVDDGAVADLARTLACRHRAGPPFADADMPESSPSGSV